MKEIFSAFGSEVFKPLVTLLIPGLICITPYYAIVYRASPALGVFLKAETAVTTLAIVCAALFVGLILEDFGTHIEAGWDELKGAMHMAEWYQYLRQAFEPEPVGHRYLRTIVLRLKFELASYAAVLVALPGAANELTQHLPGQIAYITIVISLLLCWFLRYEAQLSHQTLSTLRSELLKGIRKIPDDNGCCLTPTIPDGSRASPKPVGGTVFIVLTLTVIAILIPYLRPQWSTRIAFRLLNCGIVRTALNPANRLPVSFCICLLFVVVVYLRQKQIYEPILAWINQRWRRSPS
jgi:hypothetical protein